MPNIRLTTSARANRFNARNQDLRDVEASPQFPPRVLALAAAAAQYPSLFAPWRRSRKGIRHDADEGSSPAPRDPLDGGGERGGGESARSPAVRRRVATSAVSRGAPRVGCRTQGRDPRGQRAADMKNRFGRDRHPRHGADPYTYAGSRPQGSMSRALALRPPTAPNRTCLRGPPCVRLYA